MGHGVTITNWTTAEPLYHRHPFNATCSEMQRNIDQLTEDESTYRMCEYLDTCSIE